MGEISKKPNIDFSQFDLESIFKDTNTCRRQLLKIEEEINLLYKFPSDVATSPETFYLWLSTISKIEIQLNPAYLYSMLRRDSNSEDTEANELLSRASEASRKLKQVSAILDDAILLMSDGDFRNFCSIKSDLENWNFYFLQKKRLSAHRKSKDIEVSIADIERLTSLAQQSEPKLFNEMAFESIQLEDKSEVNLDLTNIPDYLKNSAETIREKTWVSYLRARQRHANSIAHFLHQYISGHSAIARLRGYGSSLEAAFDQANLPRAMFFTVLETFQKHSDIWRKYWKIRGKLLGRAVLKNSDLSLLPDVLQPTIPYEKAVEWIVEAVRPLGDDYADILKKGLTTERWVDIYPRKGKSLGEYCWTTDNCKPFIMVSYRDNFQSLSALAHESGHAMHSYFTYQTQPHQYAGYGRTAAEVAANTHQALLFSYLLKTQDDLHLKFAALDAELRVGIRYLMRMPINALFEHELYETVARGENLNPDMLSARYLELMRNVYGDAVMLPDAEGIEWADQPILFEHYYALQYTFGIAGGQAIAERISNAEVGAAEGYRKFISAGNSMDELDSLRLAGIELDQNEPYDRAMARITRKIEEFEALSEQLLAK
jgi:oligoendopeptidase F